MEERFKILVSKYLDDKLSDLELAEFEKYLEDSACNTYFEKAKIANQLIDESFQYLIDAVEKKAGITKEENEFPDEIIADSDAYTERNNPFIIEKVKNAHRQMILKRRKRRLFTFGPIAASFLIILSVFWASIQPPNHEKQYKKYYIKYPFEVFRGGNNSDRINILAISKYMLNEYKESSALCRNIISSNTQNPQTHLIYGLNLMEQDSMLQAIEQFNIVIDYTKMKDGIYHPAALWYKSLCYISLNDPHQAITELQKLQSLDNSFKNSYSVDSLLKDLNNK